MSNDNPGVMSKAFWSQAGGVTWASVQPLMDRLNRGVADAVIAAADPGPGGSVLDIGCGGGSTTLAMARRVAPGGRCLGVDVSETLVNDARRAVADEPAQFQLGDAQVHPFETAAFDAVMSRFGVMFFDDPVAAFSNLRRAAKPNAKLAFACWRSPADNPMVAIPMQAAAPLLSAPPPPPPSPDAPGRFSFADPDRVRGILEKSGWRDIAIAPLDAPSPISLDEQMTISVELGTLGGLLRHDPEPVRARVRHAVRAAFEPHVVDGMIPMTAACWLVTARA
jgi:SAM-dependent methyltransferase